MPATKQSHTPISVHVRPAISKADLLITHPKYGEMKIGCIYLDIEDVDGAELANDIAMAYNAAPDLLAALKAAELELEANKQAMLGPEWAVQRTATGGALLQVFQAIRRAEGGGL